LEEELEPLGSVECLRILSKGWKENGLFSVKWHDLFPLTCHETYGAADLYLVDRDVTFDIKSLFESGRNVARSGRL